MSLKNQTHGLERVANNTLFLDTPPYLVSSADLQASISTTNLTCRIPSKGFSHVFPYLSREFAFPSASLYISQPLAPQIA